MRKVRIHSTDLFWDSWNREHIKKHDVTKKEIEQALSKPVQSRKSYKGRFMIFGTTKNRRLLAIVMKKTNKGYYVFSARDASRNERKYL